MTLRGSRALWPVILRSKLAERTFDAVSWPSHWTAELDRHELRPQLNSSSPAFHCSLADLFRTLESECVDCSIDVPMGTTRPLRESDIKQLVDLSNRLFPASQLLSEEEHAARFRTLCLDNPWVDHDMPTLVHEEADGRIAGSLAVVPRAMILNGEPIRVAVSQHLMVNPDARNKLIAFDLLRTFLRGPQDLSMADMANDVSRRIWERLGGRTSNCHSLYWRRFIRPCSAFLKRRRGLVANCAVPVAKTLDTLASLVPSSLFRIAKPRTSGENVGVDQLLELNRNAASAFSLRPDYDAEFLSWLMGRLRNDERHGRLESTLVHGPDGAPLGWYVAFFLKGGISQVLQMRSASESLREILGHAAYRAAKVGANEIGGRIEMRRMRDYWDARCVVIPGRYWMLVHSSRNDVLDAIHRDDALLSRLEGDLWLL